MNDLGPIEFVRRGNTIVQSGTPLIVNETASYSETQPRRMGTITRR